MDSAKGDCLVKISLYKHEDRYRCSLASIMKRVIFGGEDEDHVQRVRQLSEGFRAYIEQKNLTCSQSKDAYGQGKEETNLKYSLRDSNSLLK